MIIIPQTMNTIIFIVIFLPQNNISTTGDTSTQSSYKLWTQLSYYLIIIFLPQNKISATNSNPLPPTTTAATQTKSSQAVLSRWNIVQQEIWELGQSWKWVDGWLGLYFRVPWSGVDSWHSWEQCSGETWQITKLENNIHLIFRDISPHNIFCRSQWSPPVRKCSPLLSPMYSSCSSSGCIPASNSTITEQLLWKRMDMGAGDLWISIKQSCTVFLTIGGDSEHLENSQARGVVRASGKKSRRMILEKENGG